MGPLLTLLGIYVTSGAAVIVMTAGDDIGTLMVAVFSHAVYVAGSKALAWRRDQALASLARAA